ncbi:type VII secretion target [Kutzneria buriramensis]|uniref:Excreted virulence factor EspC (Type VII ESX diderm) n=1 Tax=Kutzneria buriramensis TaxID=1045776 RepID=A0A3E0HZE2_9PSEU|nr:type VII secretion target [Kutzneria buriramensis]REH51636.1 excreted virulence factor EspC (type VII ESX diderm) [Kutzneria buriramensis]
MPTISAAQIAQYAYAAGFRGDSLTTAVAVALAESHGDTGIHGDVNLQTGTWGPSVGLWQIRSLNPGHGTAAEQALRNAQANADPATNARHAYQISHQGNNFRPWSTYTNGAYRNYLNQARTASRQASSGASTGGATPTSFRVAPRALEQVAAELAAQAQRLRSVRDDVGIPGPASSAFGGLPQSQQAAEAHAKTLESLASRITAQQDRASTLATGVQSSAANYQQGDTQTAASYQSLLT